MDGVALGHAAPGPGPEGEPSVAVDETHPLEEATITGVGLPGCPSTLRTSRARTRPSFTSAASALGPAGVVGRAGNVTRWSAPTVEPDQRPSGRSTTSAPAARAGRPSVSGHGSAAPYGWAGSVAASTSGGRGLLGVAPLTSPRSQRSRSTAPGSGELRSAEAGDEVAAAHLAALLEHLQHAVHAGEPADHALGQHRLAGDHAVALEQLHGRGVGRLGRAGAGLEQRRDERPPAGAGRRADAGQPARPRTAAGAAP